MKALKRSLCGDPMKEELALKGSKPIGLGLSSDLAAAELRERGCANLVAEKDILVRNRKRIVGLWVLKRKKKEWVSEK